MSILDIRCRLRRTSRLALLISIALLSGRAAVAQFGSFQPFASGDFRDAVLADLDGDGDLDPLVAHFDEPGVLWFPNLGNGDFGTPRSFPFEPQQATSVQAFDFDHDGDLDVLAAVQFYDPLSGSQESIVLWPNSGDGSFEDWVNWDQGTPAMSLRAADLEGNGTLEAFFGAWGDSSVMMMRWPHGGQQFDLHVLTDQAFAPIAVSPADIDDDGDSDLVVRSFESSLLRFENLDGNLSFGPPTTVSAVKGGGAQVADLDGDGDREIVASSGGPLNTVLQLYMNVGGGFAAPQPITSTNTPGGALARDVDADGDPDLLVGSVGGISWFANDGTAHFGAAQAISGNEATSARAFGDVDGDGLADVLATKGTLTLGWIKNLATPWTELGSGLPGVRGVPELTGSGSLAVGSAGSLALSNAAPAEPAILFVSSASTPAPFKGGTLVPVPALTTVPLATGAGGGIVLGWSAWPSGLGGQSLYFQYAVQDAAAVKGVALSGAVRADVP